MAWTDIPIEIRDQDEIQGRRIGTATADDLDAIIATVDAWGTDRDSWSAVGQFNVDRGTFEVILVEDD